jgi:hypothetical protein
MSKNPGIIYDIGNGEYGLALHSEQKPAFKNYGKVFMRVYQDILCTIPATHPDNGKKLITLKHITEIRQVGYQD